MNSRVRFLLVVALLGCSAALGDAVGGSPVEETRARHAFHFVATPLGEAVRKVSEAYDVKFHIDANALRSQGLSPETPVTWRAKDATLQKSLARMFEPLGLAYRIENGVIKITSEEDQELVTRTYAVYDLLTPVRDRKITARDFDSLVDRIKQHAAPGTWGEAGRIIPFPDNLSLVISHNESGHEAVQWFLAGLRQSTSDRNPK